MSASVRPRSDPQPRISIQLAEWESLAPGSQPQARLLRGLSFGDDEHARSLAEKLQRAYVVSIVELRDGLSVDTFNFVGRVAVGPLDITIEPKITWSRWLPLIGYALRLRDVTKSERLTLSLDSFSLADIIALELVAEAGDLIARGLHREYVRRRQSLAAPRGRIDFARIAQQGGIQTGSIPCRYTRRSNDSPINRVLLAGLQLAASIARDGTLRADARRLAHELEISVTVVRLSNETLRAAQAAVDRRTARYSPAIRLIELLLRGQSVTWEDEPNKQTVQIPGFALDMSRVWQRLLGRVLGDWGSGFEVREEFGLKGVFQSDARYPFRGEAPIPRPDFAAFRDAQLIGFLDAKYRDLSAHSLPRDMLYQLAIYAMAQGGGVATILFPTDSTWAREQRLDILNPFSRRVRATIALRPIQLAKLEALITSKPSDQRSDKRRQFARSLVLGDLA